MAFMPMPLPLAQVAARQLGAFTFAQAVRAKMSPATLGRRCGTDWVRLFPGVYAAGERSDEQSLVAAMLWAGKEAVVSHGAAGRLLKLDGLENAGPELTLPLSTSARCPPGVLIHRGDIPAGDRRVLGSLTHTKAARTLIDLASCLEPLPLAVAFEDAWRRKLMPLGWIQRRLKDLGPRGRSGARALRLIIEDAARRKTPMRSALEVELWWLLKGSDLPLPVPGHEFEHGEGQPGEIDFAYPKRRLAIEADGFEIHSQREVFERDRVRLSRLAAAGWRVIHVTKRQLKDPGPVLNRIRKALRSSPQDT